MPAKKDAQYYRDYRARKAKAALEDNATEDVAMAEEGVRSGSKLPREIMTDKERGLPRSNYAGPVDGPGGWQETIQGIDPKLAIRILDHPAVRTPKRG